MKKICEYSDFFSDSIGNFMVRFTGIYPVTILFFNLKMLSTWRLKNAPVSHAFNLSVKT